LTLGFFQEQIGADVVRQIQKITFCGNDGDPIYCRDLLDIIQWVKSVNPAVSTVIITNGSHKKSDWWQRLGIILGPQDELHFSIDGWDQESNQQYRVNSNWNSVREGVQAFRTANDQTYMVWASIAFRFNQDHMDSQKTLAQNWKFDLYQLTKSTKFGSKYPDSYPSNDPLEPTIPALVAAGHRFERLLFEISHRPRPGDKLRQVFLQRAEDLDKQKKYSGICLIGNKGVFLNSRGEFFPCCWTANRYQHNKQWHQLAQTRFNLWHRPFSEIIADPFWYNEFLNFNSTECRTKCTPEKLKDIEHTTEW
jgi:MoaA/NifB/PqqE/SkfB family radical SAM enzyme